RGSDLRSDSCTNILWPSLDSIKLPTLKTLYGLASITLFCNVSSCTGVYIESTIVSVASRAYILLSLSIRKVTNNSSPCVGHTSLTYGKSTHGIKTSLGRPTSTCAPSRSVFNTFTKSYLLVVMSGMFCVANNAPDLLG